MTEIKKNKVNEKIKSKEKNFFHNKNDINNCDINKNQNDYKKLKIKNRIFSSQEFSTKETKKISSNKTQTSCKSQKSDHVSHSVENNHFNLTESSNQSSILIIIDFELSFYSANMFGEYNAGYISNCSLCSDQVTF